MMRWHPNTILGALAVTFGLVLIFVWVPLDSATGIAEPRRGKYVIGDGLAPTVAGVFFVVPGLLMIFGPRPENAPRLERRDWRFLAGLLALAALGILLMRYAGPLIAAGIDGGYRPLRATAPWKFIGFLLGGAWFVGATISLVEGRVTWRAVVIGVAAAAIIAFLYDVPFEDLLLPPNGDV